MDGMLLQTVEALRDSPFVSPMGQSWELLQAEKEEVSREILSEASLLKETDAALDAYEPSEESTRAIQWHYREALEDRLRAINDAQDRLLDGGYGVCLDCGQQIGGKQLLADPAASLCRLPGVGRRRIVLSNSLSKNSCLTNLSQFDPIIVGRL